MCQVHYTKGEMLQKQIKAQWLSLEDFYFLLNSGSSSKSSGFQRATRSGFYYWDFDYSTLPIEHKSAASFCRWRNRARGSKVTCLRFHNWVKAEGHQTMPPQLWLQKPRTPHSKTCCFGVLITLNYRHLKSRTCRKRIYLTSPICQEVNPLEGTLSS